MEYYSAIKKGTPVIWDNIDELGKYYAEWNKPGIESKIMHDPTYMWNLKIIKTIRTECGMMVAGGWRKWGNVGQREKVLDIQDE